MKYKTGSGFAGGFVGGGIAGGNLKSAFYGGVSGAAFSFVGDLGFQPGSWQQIDAHAVTWK